ncbi:MAG: PDZ domain-containing protein [Candidatus Marinimicrobia bacterium]|nr:PDZ domain-containing protein [Candidatus Neomarinimicrobiota bacterium]
MFRKSLFVLLISSLLCSFVLAGVDAKMLRYPDVSDTHICFVYAGDIWIVDKDGGVANKLSSPKGQEQFPRFSPDGSKIAFTGNYDGNNDIYVIPAMGGIAERMTYHQMTDRMLDWYPDGKSILFNSHRQSGRQRYGQFYSIATDNGFPKKLSVPYGEFASLSPDGNKIAYVKRSRDFRTWKRYRGGMAADIWIFNLKTGKAEEITDTDANESQPMWHGDMIYFASDRGEHKRYNVWAYNTQTKQVKQLTHFKDYDIHFPSIGPDEIVFQAGSDIYLLDLQNSNVKKVNIDVVTDKSTIKPQNINVAKYISGGSISPKGKRVLLQARGEIFSVPVEEGYTKNLTQSSGTAERFPKYAPDGKHFVYWSDASGEYQLVLQSTQNSDKEVLTDFEAGYRYQPYWSPDSKKLVFIDNSMDILLYDLDKKEVEKIDHCYWKMHGGLRSFSVDWSSDSKWLTYSHGGENQNGIIFLYNTEKDKLHQLTTQYYDDADPAFDPSGKYLYFLSNRHFSPEYSDMDNSFIYPNATKLVAVSLRKDVESPLSPKNDTVSVKTEDEENDKEKEDKDKNGKKKEGKQEEKELKIDLANFEERMVILPPDHGNYSDVSAVEGKVLYMQHPLTGSQDKDKELKFFDLEEREEKVIISGISGYQLSADKNKLLVRKNGKLAVIDVAPEQKMEDVISTDDLNMELDPLAEWNQIYNDAWRIVRDYFYDPNMHGVDWNQIKKKYGKLLEDAVTRSDVNYLIGEMIAELNASHTYRGGGSLEEAEKEPVGCLGVNFKRENGYYKIEKIIQGASWDNKVRSPFDRSGVEVKQGDYILAINGIQLSDHNTPWKALSGLSNKTVEITYNDKPTMENAKQAVVKTLDIGDEVRLRHLNWIEHNRKYVENKSNGKVGYIYVRSTGVDAQNELVRQFQAQFKKPALIIDERFNSGGQIPDRFIELLDREPLSYWAVRDGKDWQWPPVAHFGPKAMLINGWSGSGGDALPYYFRKAGLGKLIGMRTWGGLIGISGTPQLIDKGMVTAPSFRMYSTQGKWFAEGHGVEPDIRVVDDPEKLAKGQDPQLDKAIEVLLKQLKKQGEVKPERPDYEKR